MDELTIKAGITDKQIDKLVEYANSDPEVQKTSDPKRFANKEMALKWFESKKPVIYVLTDKTNNLLGIVWFHTEEVPAWNYTGEFNPKDYQITMAIRLYGEARGKGLAEDFLKACLEKFHQTKDYKDLSRKGLWLGTSPENSAAIHLYENLGFVKVGESSKLNRVLMILRNEK